MATREAKITGEATITVTAELIAKGEAEVQSVQTTCDGRIVALQDRHFACWPSSQLEFSLVLIFVD